MDGLQGLADESRATAQSSRAVRVVGYAEFGLVITVLMTPAFQRGGQSRYTNSKIAI